jgi:flagellar protein FlbD
VIRLTRLDGREFFLNCDLIEFFESTPDTVITLRTEKKIIVKEPVPEVLNRIITYKQSIFATPFYQKGSRIMINSDSPDLFYNDKDLKNMKNIRDIQDIEFEGYNEDEYEEDDE